MTNINRIRHWALLAVLVATAGLIVACDQGTTSTTPTQPAARNFEQPQTTIVVASFAPCETAEGGLIAIFTNTTTGEVNKFLWEFGDGKKSTATNPVHEYDKAGTYLVTLTATNKISSDTAAGFCTVGVAEEADPLVPAEGDG